MNNKKGIVFTILALVISSFILIMFFYMIELPSDHSVEVTRMKVRTVNNFLGQADDLIRTQAVISSRQSINHMLREMYSDSDFLANFDDEFVNCLESGEFDGGTTCGPFSNLKELIEDNLSSFLSENVGLNADFLISDISLNQSMPWALDLFFSVNIVIEDDLFFWNITENISEQISVLGFKDPAQVVVDSSMSSHKPNNFVDIPEIKMNKLYRNLSGDWLESPSTLSGLTRSGSYFESSDYGVSFLDRLRGNFTTSDLGIVSVYPVIYVGNSPFRSGASSLDWQYWQDDNNNFGGDSFGNYSFTDPNQITEMLDILQIWNLTNERTIHDARIPVDLANAANMSDSSYFFSD
ncbi:MAG: hypothetical protein ACLFN8_02535 [Candidatus Woesearchaeota archaeon]